MKIGICISGGGYRATTYSLGTLSYLNHLKLDDKPLLQHVIALSTVSGGSITGITYAQSVKNKTIFNDYLKWMYTTLTEFDLVETSMNNFVNPSNQNSLIEGFAKSYLEHFLNNKKFDSIMPIHLGNGVFDTHLLYNCINATDFNTGTPFRFIAQCEWKHSANKEVKDFIVGNYFFKIRKNISNLPLNVAMAASSCFPGGFEPILLDLKEHIPNSENFVDKVSLMDGGIVDNQGVDSLLKLHEKIPLDLAFIIDSSSPHITKYDESEKIKIPIIGNWQLGYITIFVILLNIMMLIGIIYNFNKNNVYTLLFTITTTLLTLLSFILIIGKKIISNLANNNNILASTIRPLNTVTPNSFLRLLRNRLNSVSLLVGSVFMKHLRRKNISSLYEKIEISPEEAKQIKEKVFVNTIYQLKELNEEEKFLKLGIKNIPSKDSLGFTFLPITKEIQEICERAFKMETTLWVPKGIKGKKIIQDVLVAGHLTTCVSLIEFYNTKNNDVHNPIYEQAKEDWNKFVENPYWLLEKQGILKV